MIISGVSFTFEYVLLAPTGSWATVIAPSEQESIPRFLQKLEALAQAFDHVESRRSISAVVPHFRSAEAIGIDIMAVARVIVVSDHEIEDDLVSLLPLRIPEQSLTSVDAVDEVFSSIPAKTQALLGGSALRMASASGSKEVTKSFIDWIEQPVNGEGEV